ncbi:MAG: aldehyde dehydrogenase family protein [Betaproteobacteria bacterium]|nr:aldehyde dehydrogenase family protein [Betaproteobacteria bacterium]
MGHEVAASVIETGKPNVYGLLINGKWIAGDGPRITVRDKYLLQPYATVTAADSHQVKMAVGSAHVAFCEKKMTPYERGAVLEKAVQILEKRTNVFILAMQSEAGFTESDASGEIKRCIQTIKLSAEEARRLAGEVIPMSGAPGASGRIGFTMRVPLGVIAAITPFNSPLNTVAHKVAPAFAAGNSIILKPSSYTPVTACLFAEVLTEAGMPHGFVNVLHGSAEVVKHLQNDERVRFFAFTGSTEVGRQIQQGAGLRRTQMELGSIAFTILCDDAKLDIALPKVVNAGFRKAGQVCTSVQLLLVHKTLVDETIARLVPMVQALTYGDPHDAQTFVGPVISEDNAIRIENWINEAVAAGAHRLVGGPRVGSVIPPTLLSQISPEMKVGCNEIFGPVVAIIPFCDMDEAIQRVNATPYGLATGIFTNRLKDAFNAAQKLEVGGVHINETSSSRVDLMPYGGSKDSGFGREGPRYAVHEMTEERILTLTTV